MKKLFQSATEPDSSPTVPEDESDETLTSESVFKEQFDTVASSLEALHEKFDTRLREDVAREQLFNQVYDDLQARRREQLDDHLLPLVRSVLLVVDRLEATGPSALGSDSNLETVRAELMDALYAAGVERIDVAPDERDGRLQRIVATIPATDGMWEERKPGYMMGTRVIRAQQIAVPDESARGEPA